MSKAGKRIIEGLNEALAWTRGEGTLRLTEFINGKRITRDITMDEYLSSGPPKAVAGGNPTSPDDTRPADDDFAKLRRD